VKRKTICVYIDAELVEEAAKAAEAQGLSLSGLVEEALRLYVLYVLRRPEPRRRGGAKKVGRKPAGKPQQGSPRREDFPVGNSLQGYASAAAQSAAPAPPPQDAVQLPPHLKNNVWIAVLRSRR